MTNAELRAAALKTAQPAYVEDDVYDFTLPLTPDGERTFQVNLGGVTYAFRSYFVEGFQDLWYLDITTIDGVRLAMGRRLVPGSINMFKGYANALDVIAATVLLSEGTPGALEAPGSTLQVAWYPNKNALPFKDGDPMEYLYENFKIAQ